MARGGKPLAPGIGDADGWTRKYRLTLLFATKAKGTGLGLSICYQIVSQHHGSIDVKNKQGEGTTFTVSLPIAVDRWETGKEVAE